MIICNVWSQDIINNFLRRCFWLLCTLMRVNFSCVIPLVHANMPNKVLIIVGQYKEKNSEFVRLIFIVFPDTAEVTVSCYTPFIKTWIWTKIKSSWRRSVDTPDRKSWLVTLIINCRLSKLRMICKADISEMIETNNFASPSYIGLNTDCVSLTKMNDLNWFKLGNLS